MKKFCYLLLLQVVFTKVSTAQVDPHFSQYYAYPLQINPGLTGMIDGDFRASVNMRRQWASIIPNPFQTMGLSFDVKTNNNISYGGHLLNLSAGDAGYNILHALGSISYQISWGADGENVISAGFQGGIINRRLDFAKLKFGSQYSSTTGFDPNLPSNEPFSGNRQTTNLDVNLGLVYINGSDEHTINPFVGASVLHVIEPKNAFLNASESKLPRLYVLHGGARIKMGEGFSVTPNMVYMRQVNSEEKMIGAFGQVRINDNTDMLLGGNYRFDDAVSPFVGLQTGGLMFGFSYDATLSNLNKLVPTSGFEVSITYVSKSKIKTDRKNPICPRL